MADFISCKGAPKRRAKKVNFTHENMHFITWDYRLPRFATLFFSATAYGKAYDELCAQTGFRRGELTDTGAMVECETAACLCQTVPCVCACRHIEHPPLFCAALEA
jgi:hypothetical protein